MDLGLKNRVAIVAAASKGLGRAVAIALAQEGARLAICARAAFDLEETAVEIRAAGAPDVFWQPLDVTDAARVAAFVDAVEKKFSRIEICVTNAGGPPSRPFA